MSTEAFYHQLSNIQKINYVYLRMKRFHEILIAKHNGDVSKLAKLCKWNLKSTQHYVDLNGTFGKEEYPVFVQMLKNIIADFPTQRFIIEPDGKEYFNVSFEEKKGTNMLVGLDQLPSVHQVFKFYEENPNHRGEPLEVCVDVDDVLSLAELAIKEKVAGNFREEDLFQLASNIPPADNIGFYKK